MDISVIYVNWNSAADILCSVESVCKLSRGVSFEIIIVDNHSKEPIDPLARDDIQLIRNPVNAGFGAACNIGVSASSGDMLLFLNPDTVLENNVLKTLKDYLDARPGSGAAGPMILEEDGSVHFGAARAFPSLTNEFFEHTTLAFRYPHRKPFGNPYYSYWNHRSEREVDCLLGACMMFKKTVFEGLGGFDDRFFLYYEEIDLCKRTWDAGYSIHYVPSCSILHKSKRSTTKKFGNIDTMTLEYLKSAAIYFKKHNSEIYTLFWRLMLAGIYLLRYIKSGRKIYLSYIKQVIITCSA